MKYIIVLLMLAFTVSMVMWSVLYRCCFVLMDDISMEEFSTYFIRKIILKYDNCRKIGIPVDNIHSFVDKNIKRGKICGCSIDLMEKLSQILKYLVISLGIILVMISFSNVNLMKNAVFAVMITGIAEILMDMLVRFDRRIEWITFQVSGYLYRDNNMDKMSCEPGYDVNLFTGKRKWQKREYLKTDFVKMGLKTSIEIYKMNKCLEKFEKINAGTFNSEKD